MTVDIWLPGFERVTPVEGRRGHSARRADAPSRCVLHTDEIPNANTRLIAAEHPNPPQLWVHPGRRQRFQLIPLNLTGYALRRDTPLETNHMGRHNVQVEIGATADSTHAWPDDWYRWLATEVIRPIHEATGIPLVAFAPVGRDSNGGYGTRAPSRMSPQKWETFTGFCGHQNVPGNSHWDPGRLPFARLMDLASPPKTPEDDVMWIARATDPQGRQRNALVSGIFRTELVSNQTYTEAVNLGAKVRDVTWTFWHDQLINARTP